MNLTKILTLAACGLACAVAQGQIVAFNFNDNTSITTSLSASTVASGLLVTNFSVSDGSNPTDSASTTGSPDGFAIREAGSWDETSISDGKYFAFTITPIGENSFDLTNISFDYRQTSTGAANYQISIGSTTNAASGAFTRDSAFHNVSSSLTLLAISSATEIRIYGLNGGSGSFSIDNVTLSGTVNLASIPEPSTAALLGGVMALGLVATQRRKRSA